MQSIVGYTGFVGGNIAAAGDFVGQYNSKNIGEAFGTQPDLLVFAGLPAEKFVANKEPEADLQKVQEAMANIRRIAPKRVVLISTIDVYQKPCGVDELTAPLAEQPYGKHRLFLEKWVTEEFSEHLVVRLPGLFGRGLKKNFIYDYIHFIPALLNEAKYAELAAKSELVKQSYAQQANGFYRLNIAETERGALRAEFERLGFSALNFTDSRGVFQYYNLAHLWQDIEKALANGIKLLNVATEPVRIDELYRFLCGGEFKNELLAADMVPHYDFRSQQAGVFGGHDGYLYDKATVLQEIRDFVKSSVRA